MYQRVDLYTFARRVLASWVKHHMYRVRRTHARGRPVMWSRRMRVCDYVCSRGARVEGKNHVCRVCCIYAQDRSFVGCRCVWASNLNIFARWVLTPGVSGPLCMSLAYNRHLYMRGVRFVLNGGGLRRQWTRANVHRTLRRVLTSRRMRPALLHARCSVLFLSKVGSSVTLQVPMCTVLVD